MPAMRRFDFASPLLTRLLLFLILLTALVLRFRWLIYIEHNVDHAYPVWQAITTLDRGILPLAGQGTSVLFANPPLTGYLFLPVIALARLPLAAYVLVIALNTVGVWCCWRAARGMIGTAGGLVAAWLMAVNPWVIEYSRATWVQGLLPFFTCAVAWLLWPVLMGEARHPVRRTALALVMAAFMAHTYLLAYFILAPVGLLLVIFRKRVPLRGVLIGGAVFALLAGLYGAGLLMQIDTVQARLDSFSSGESRLKTEALEGAVRLVTGAEYAAARGLDAPAKDAPLRQQLSQIAHGALALCLGIGVLSITIEPPKQQVFTGNAKPSTPRPPSPSGRRGRVAFEAPLHEGEGFGVRAKTTNNRDTVLILLLWFGLPIVAMSYTSNPVHPFYQLLTLPAGYVLAAWGIMSILRVLNSLFFANLGISAPLRRFSSFVFVTLLLLHGLLMSVNSARYGQETAATPTAHNLLALPVGLGMEIGAEINTLLPPGGTVYAEAEDWILNSLAGRLFPVVWEANWPTLTILPAAGGVYVAPRPDAPPGIVEARTLNGITISRADSMRLQWAETVELPSQQGLTLIGYTVQPAATPGQWQLESVWRVDGISPEVPDRIFAPFVHVNNETGERVVNAGGAGVAGTLWRQGDFHVHRMTFEVPLPPPFTLLLGQYDGLHNANIIFLPPGADPTVTVEIRVDPS
ncbi:MAG: hypothetical protein SF029_10810 [bacterium]|nr:hypothetical protein [bacterium]